MRNLQLIVVCDRDIFLSIYSSLFPKLSVFFYLLPTPWRQIRSSDFFIARRERTLPSTIGRTKRDK